MRIHLLCSLLTGTIRAAAAGGSHHGMPHSLLLVARPNPAILIGLARVPFLSLDPVGFMGAKTGLLPSLLEPTVPREPETLRNDEQLRLVIVGVT